MDGVSPFASLRGLLTDSSQGVTFQENWHFYLSPKVRKELQHDKAVKIGSFNSLPTAD